MPNPRPNRVLFLIDSLGMGGAERMLVNYLQHLDVNRYEPRVCVFGVRDGNPVAAEIERLGIPVDLISVPRIRDFINVMSLVRYLRLHQIDLVHTQLETVTVHGGIAAKIVGIPTVHTLHTFAYPNATARETRRTELVWFSLRHFHDKIIAVSAAVGDYAVSKGRVPLEKISVLYNGIDTRSFSPRNSADRVSVRTALGIPDNAALVITVAVLRREKGIQYLIETWPDILKSVPNAYYLVVGAGPYESTLKSLAAKHNITDRVIFAGPRNDVPDLLRSSDLFALPTLNDVLPTVLAEAMASGLPIVASRVGGVPEMIEPDKNGLLVSPADKIGLANACIRLLCAPNEAQRLAEGGRDIAEARFNVRNQVQKLETLYEELLKKPMPNELAQ
ncbi:glycosyltransferase [Methylocaldum sp.]|uniref:glycosyltransferase n=1 Tax=Methylocaldum sp. TaxID=1969727 RepID=UPI002D38D5D9|nr:glycosyltransferase [Methylocaldum sp.]HYE34629.1 glycosyltransferase [Methylocaldum sp.]